MEALLRVWLFFIDCYVMVKMIFREVKLFMAILVAYWVVLVRAFCLRFRLPMLDIKHWASDDSGYYEIVQAWFESDQPRLDIKDFLDLYFLADSEPSCRSLQDFLRRAYVLQDAPLIISLQRKFHETRSLMKISLSKEYDHLAGDDILYGRLSMDLAQ